MSKTLDDVPTLRRCLYSLPSLQIPIPSKPHTLVFVRYTFPPVIHWFSFGSVIVHTLLSIWCWPIFSMVRCSVLLMMMHSALIIYSMWFSLHCCFVFWYSMTCCHSVCWATNDVQVGGAGTRYGTQYYIFIHSWHSRWSSAVYCCCVVPFFFYVDFIYLFICRPLLFLRTGGALRCLLVCDAILFLVDLFDCCFIHSVTLPFTFYYLLLTLFILFSFASASAVYLDLCFTCHCCMGIQCLCDMRVLFIYFLLCWYCPFVVLWFVCLVPVLWCIRCDDPLAHLYIVIHWPSIPIWYWYLRYVVYSWFSRVHCLFVVLWWRASVHCFWYIHCYVRLEVLHATHCYVHLLYRFDSDDAAFDTTMNTNTTLRPVHSICAIHCVPFLLRPFYYDADVADADNTRIPFLHSLFPIVILPITIPLRYDGNANRMTMRFYRRPNMLFYHFGGRCITNRSHAMRWCSLQYDSVRQLPAFCVWWSAVPRCLVPFWWAVCDRALYMLLRWFCWVLVSLMLHSSSVITVR